MPEVVFPGIELIEDALDGVERGEEVRLAQPHDAAALGKAVQEGRVAQANDGCALLRVCMCGEALGTHHVEMPGEEGPLGTLVQLGPSQRGVLVKSSRQMGLEACGQIVHDGSDGKAHGGSLPQATSDAGGVHWGMPPLICSVELNTL